MDVQVSLCTLENPTHIAVDCPYSLFYRPEHLKTQSDATIYGFTLSRRKKTTIIAKFYCTQGKDGIWTSPPNAPFGGIVIEKRCKEIELEFFLICIKSWLSACGHGKLIVTAVPECYQRQSWRELLHGSYINTGFKAIRTIPTHFIFSDRSNFCDMIRSNEQRRLRKAVTAGFETNHDQITSARNIIEFLLQCHRKNGYRLSIKPSNLENLLTQFPDHFLVFSCQWQCRLAAVAITVRVSERILYYFTSAFLPEYGHYSPTLLLMDRIYEFCRQNAISLFDLGPSLDHEGNYKPSLARFKENIGGKESRKIIYELVF